MTIYTSPYPPVQIPSKSIYSYLLPKNEPNFEPSLPAFIDALTGRVVSRGELRETTLQIAFGLREVLPADVRLHRGQTALIFTPNSLAYPFALLSIIAAGGRATLANSAYTARELLHQYKDSHAHLVIAARDLLPVVLEMFKLAGLAAAEAKRRIILCEAPPATTATYVNAKQWAAGVQSVDEVAPGKENGWGWTLSDLVGKGKLEEEEKFDGEDAHETAFLCYSSGTTGKPKGVETTHRNLNAVISMVDASFPGLQAKKDVLLAVLPYYHIYGVVKLLLYPLHIGVPAVIMAKFDPTQYCANIERYKVTASLIVPPILLALVHHPAVEKYNISSLNYLSSGAAPLGGDLMKAALAKLRKVGANVDIAQGYGLTETSPVTHLVPRADTVRKMGTIGPLLPNLEARIVSDSDANGGEGIDAPKGERGELWLRGPNVMKGYLNNPEATANAITKTGWFKTGDVAMVDEDGYYSIVDRMKELIKYKGFQVPPAELESVLLQHPDVVDAAVIGIEDKQQATELPRAYIVHKSGSSLSPASRTEFTSSLQRWLESRVARHKYLRGGVVVIDAVPKSAAGKILRRELRERAKKELAEAPVRAKL